jgi:hypothetical protein
MLLLEAGSWGTGIVREPRERGTFAVGNRYQTTTGEETGCEGLSACCSELRSVWTSDSTIVNCSYDKCSVHPITNPNPVRSHSITWQLGSEVECHSIIKSETSIEWMHIHSSDKSKKFKQTLSACQKANGNCFLWQERSADGGIHATGDHNNDRSVLRDTIKTAYGQPSRTKGVECWHPV